MKRCFLSLGLALAMFALLAIGPRTSAQAASMPCRSWRTWDGWTITHCGYNPRWMPQGTIPTFYLQNHTQAMELLPLNAATGIPDASITLKVSLPPPTPASAWLYGEPCQQAAIWPTSLYTWETPIGCYGGVYWVNHGDCFGWVRYLHPNIQSMQRHSYPIPGAVAAFYPGTSYGGQYGHYAQVIAVRPGWLFISEENMWWRGGGYDRVTYRYLPLAGHNDIVYLW